MAYKQFSLNSAELVSRLAFIQIVYKNSISTSHRTQPVPAPRTKQPVEGQHTLHRTERNENGFKWIKLPVTGVQQNERFLTNLNRTSFQMVLRLNMWKQNKKIQWMLP